MRSTKRQDCRFAVMPKASAVALAEAEGQDGPSQSTGGQPPSLVRCHMLHTIRDRAETKEAPEEKSVRLGMQKIARLRRRGRAAARNPYQPTVPTGTIASPAPVAQLDRALASGAKGRAFESHRARQTIPSNATTASKPATTSPFPIRTTFDKTAGLPFWTLPRAATVPANEVSRTSGHGWPESLNGRTAVLDVAACGNGPSERSEQDLGPRMARTHRTGRAHRHPSNGLYPPNQRRPLFPSGNASYSNHCSPLWEPLASGSTRTPPKQRFGRKIVGWCLTDRPEPNRSGDTHHRPPPGWTGNGYSAPSPAEHFEQHREQDRQRGRCR